MTPLIGTHRLARLFGRGLIAAAVLSAFGVRAGDAASETTQGAAAVKLQQNDASSFIREAIHGNESEVALGELAGRKARTSEVKGFAATLVKDHSQNMQELQPIAQAHGVNVSRTVDAKHQAKLENLREKDGKEFEKDYVRLMLRDHQQDIAKFEKAEREIDDSDVKQYAKKTLPTLRQHLQQAKRTAESIGMTHNEIAAAIKGSEND